MQQVSPRICIISSDFERKDFFMFSIFINFCSDEFRGKKVIKVLTSNSFCVCVRVFPATNQFKFHLFLSLPPPCASKLSKKFKKKDSSESSIDDDPYVDEPEEALTDHHQSQNNQTSSVTAGSGNTLPIKSSGIAARSVIVLWIENSCMKVIALVVSSLSFYKVLMSYLGQGQ